MSASPMARQSVGQNIPTRRVQLGHVSELPSDYSSTPGGTIFSTTPGGTRIVYTGQFLRQLRDSPLARTPPAHMHHVPGITKTSPSQVTTPEKQSGGDAAAAAAATAATVQQKHDDEPQFEMDM